MNICEKISAFELRQIPRRLRIAELLGEQFDSGEGELSESAFAIMDICLPYIETVEQYRSGEPSVVARPSGKGYSSKSKEFFSRSMDRIFPELGSDAPSLDFFYGNIRSGMTHSSVAREGVGFSRDLPTPIVKVADGWVINPWLFALRLLEDAQRYVYDLNDGGDQDLRDKFERTYDRDLQPEIDPSFALGSTTPAANSSSTNDSTTTGVSTTPGANPS